MQSLSFSSDRGLELFNEICVALNMNPDLFIQGVVSASSSCNVQSQNFVKTQFNIGGIVGDVTNYDDGRIHIRVEL